MRLRLERTQQIDRFLQPFFLVPGDATGNQVQGRVQLERLAGHGRSYPVVEVATQATPFLFASGDDLLARAAQVVGQSHGVDGRPRLAGDGEQQLLFGWSK